MIELTDLRRAFGTKTALAGLTLSAADGQVTGLLGPNGAARARRPAAPGCRHGPARRRRSGRHAA